MKYELHTLGLLCAILLSGNISLNAMVSLSAAVKVVAATFQPLRADRIDAEGCGQRPLKPGPPSVTPFVVGGKEVEPKFSFPWMCSLQSISSVYHTCGCSLIKNLQGEYYVLTAAHCVSSSSVRYLKALVGAHNIKNTTEPSRQNLRFSRLYVHQQYDSNTLENDIAIFSLLNQPVENDYVQPVCIPNTTYVAGETSVVTGWGHTILGGTTSNVLMEGSQPIVNDEACAEAYGNEFFPDNMMCAGLLDVGGVDACQKDSGGPLVVYQDGEWKQVGVVSWGRSCALPGFPGVYADVFGLRQWIDSIIN